MRNREYPGAEAPRVAIAIDAAIRPDQRVLHDVFGVDGAANALIHETKQRNLIALRQDLKAGPAAGLRSTGKLLVD